MPEESLHHLLPRPDVRGQSWLTEIRYGARLSWSATGAVCLLWSALEASWVAEVREATTAHRVARTSPSRTESDTTPDHTVAAEGRDCR